MTLPQLTTKQKTLLISLVLAVVACAPGIYFYMQYRRVQSRLTNPTLFAQEETNKTILAVGKLMIVPTDETPTVANITDRDKLANQPFFTHAENGDKVLIYTNAKKAILYRESINKIIEVAPINIGATASAAPAVTTQPVTFSILNGTDVDGLTKTFETQLKAKQSGAQITNRDNAKARNYQKSLIVDVTGTHGAQLSQLATDLGLTVSTLPSGEATPAADFVIILGNDKK